MAPDLRLSMSSLRSGLSTIVLKLKYVLITLTILAFIAHTYYAAAGVRQNGRKKTRRAQIIGLILTLVCVGFLWVFRL